MRARRIVAGVAVLAAAAVGNQAVKADPGLRLLDPASASLEAQRTLEAVSGVLLNVVRDARGLAHSVGAPAGALIALPQGARPGDPEAMARAHLDRFGALFGATDPRRELALLPQAEGLPDDVRDVFVRFQQLRSGMPVLGGELAVVLDRSGGLRSISGELLPAGAAPAPAKVDAERARTTALDVVERANPGVDRRTLHAEEPTLTYLDPALVGIPARLGLRPGPVWHAEVTDHGAIRRAVLVDAATGVVRFDWNMIAHSQAVCDTKNQPNESLAGPACKKGSYVSTSSGEPKNAFANTGLTQNFYDTYVGLDLDSLIGSDFGDGKKLRSTVRFCPANEECVVDPGTGLGLLSNAFWNGTGMFYGDGWTAGDDIVAHELTHGVTEKTSRLLYFYQSGAINESLSDIFGEMTDLLDGKDGGGLTQTPWAIGEDAPLTELPLRDMKDPLLTLAPPQPDRMTSAFYDADASFLDNGGVHVNSGVGNKAAYLLVTGNAGAEFNGQKITGIGFKKASRIFFRTQRMLTSGADYQDWGAALNQACKDLTGTFAIAASTCEQVAKVVTAVEMTKQPTVELAAAPEAPFCPSGLRGDYILNDGFESLSSKRWTLGSQWIEIAEYASQGKKSVWGIEPDTATSSSLTLIQPMPIAKGVSTFLRFEHQYCLDAAPFGPYYDGAKVEYREPGESTWHVLTSKPWVNGPKKKITPEGGTAYTGFGGNSAGYTSSRVDLTSLGGKKVFLRWRVIGDKQIAYDGWTVDDVRIFACGKDVPSTVGTANITPRKGAVNIAWTAPPYVPSGGIKEYKVEFVGRGTRTTKPTTLSTTFGDLKKGQKVVIKVTPVAKNGKKGPSVTRNGVAG